MVLVNILNDSNINLIFVENLKIRIYEMFWYSFNRIFKCYHNLYHITFIDTNYNFIHISKTILLGVVSFLYLKQIL